MNMSRLLNVSSNLAFNYMRPIKDGYSGEDKQMEYDKLAGGD